MVEALAPDVLQALLASDTQFTLLDVRERGEFDRGHIPGATLLPRGDLELKVGRVVVRRDWPVVVYCDDGSRAQLAAETLAALRYARPAVLDGGLIHWRAAGLPVEVGQHHGARAYAARLAADLGVPLLSVTELLELQARGEPHYVLDVRSRSEYARGHIPGAWSVPSEQLPLSVAEIVGVRQALVITCCAGRTRSIIGAHLLREIGVPRVRALADGVLAWAAAGLPLATGRELVSTPPELDRPPMIGATALAGLLASRNPPAVLDLRSLGRYAAGHIRGALWMPRGQLETRLPGLVPERGTAIVLCDDMDPRTVRAAGTLHELGYRDVWALDAVAVPALGFLHDPEFAPRTTWAANQALLPEEVGFPADVEPSPADLDEFIRWRGPAALPPELLDRALRAGQAPPPAASAPPHPTTL